MIVAKVAGTIVATQKVESMRGYKLLAVEPYRLESKQRESLEGTGQTLVAVDTLGAGEGELILLTQGSSALLTDETKDLPIDSVVVGIINTIHVAQRCVFDRENSYQ